MHGSGGRVPGQSAAGAAARRFGRDVAPLLARHAYSASPAGGRWRTTLHASPRLPELEGMGPAATAGPPEFLWLGRLDVPKQPTTFVRACALAARSRDVRGVVVGDGPLRPEVEEEARRLGAPVTFVGETADVAGYLERAWAVCLFSGFEGVPFTVQEAMWAGRAVVLSPLPSLRWFAGPAASYAADVDSAAAALVELADETVAKDRGAAAAARVRSLLSPDDPYPGLLADYGRPPR
jgi:glycosyltransferase involved in cell wall biosynthesis